MTDGVPPYLAVEHLEVSHDGLIAVRDANLVVGEGQRVALLGLNGAGKSSLLSAIAGLVRPSAGRVSLGGEDITRLAPHAVLRKGIALVPEQRDLFPLMSVAENLAMGSFIRRDSQALEQDLQRVLDYFPVLRQRLTQAAYTLSGGEQQMLAVSRALLVRPKVLLLDEPSLGLAPKALHHIIEILLHINREYRTAIVLVEQNTRIALAATEMAYVMETGRIIFSGDSRSLTENDLIRRQLFAVD